VHGREAEAAGYLADSMSPGPPGLLLLIRHE